jgi:hypothetical protein
VLKSSPGLTMKAARILDWEDDVFGLEYDNNLGQRNTMRLDAGTYEKAVREAKSYLGINTENLDEAGTLWEIE